MTEPESFVSMNHSEEASLSGTAPVPSISRHGKPDDPAGGSRAAREVDGSLEPSLMFLL